jgi:hypothetical protein
MIVCLFPTFPSLKAPLTNLESVTVSVETVKRGWGGSVAWGWWWWWWLPCGGGGWYLCDFNYEISEGERSTKPLQHCIQDPIRTDAEAGRQSRGPHVFSTATKGTLHRAILKSVISVACHVARESCAILNTGNSSIPDVQVPPYVILQTHSSCNTKQIMV